MNNRRQTLLIVLDGWGHRLETKDNAILNAKKPNFDAMWEKYPHALLDASSLAVGLPEGQMGNSEIGHMTIGAGTTIDTDLVRIGKAIESGEFAKNPALVALFDHVKQNDSTLHVQGLVSRGGVHSHSEHLFAVLRAARDAGLKRVAVHVFTDGRDTPPQSAAKFLKELEDVLEEVKIGFIASISGRFYAMDRDNNWDRLSKAEQAIFECKGNVCTLKPSEYVASLYTEGKLDEHLEPIVCLGEDGKGCAISQNDAVFFFNFRADRARMLSQRIIEKAPEMNLLFATLTEYSNDLKCLVAFPPKSVETTIAKEVSAAGLTQAHIAETEKFPHATYFLNGGVEKPYPGEEHILVPSRKDVPTHDLAPKMRAKEIADHGIEQIEKGTDFIFINFANVDMVGHTANVPAIVEAVEEVDTQLGRLLETMNKKGGVMFITADHGNAEVNVDQETGEKHTAHTTNLVPAIITDTQYAMHDGTLSDVAPTVLKLLDLPQPVAMTGKSLI
ncbi:MAG TPA: 2,3-bisphosphoglycerate-independent phosphoglycerate mutase [Candidatus Paceibacterota bacterium]|jgi:2,3-bisphosphoglycerate-independent phosphoglycerate mutase|nr:2,3-bisphosphoglycerate-independent phosphoglycerate mutase [Candidatus Paceibacterota bacterium]